MNQVEQWVQRGFGVLIIPLVVAASYALAELSWLVVVPGSAVPASGSLSPLAPLVSPSGYEETAGDRLDLRTLSRWTLFGDQPKVAPTPVPTAQDEAIKAPETKLNLELHGVFVAEDPKRSSAIIAEMRGRGGDDDKLLYAIGDALPGNATLERVYSDRIILRRNGRVETLKFSKEEDGMLINGKSYDAGKQEPRVISSRPSRSGASGAFTGRRPPATKQEPSAERLGGQNSSTTTPPAELAKNPTNNPLFNGIQNQTEATLTQLGLTTIDPSEGGGYLITSSAPRQLLNMLPVSVGDKI
ncbi:MAG: type II secretion system protein N, partial [Gammaproteobacteria bacterium]